MKKILLILIVFSAAFLFSGCSIPTSLTTNKSPMANATVLKTVDSGVTWQTKNRIDDKKTIANVNVLSMAIDPVDSNIIYLGTESNGLYMSKDAGENWTQVPFADKAYGLVINPKDHNVMYASGVFNNRAKIYKRMMEGQEWKEVYTEPADGSIISSLVINRVNPQVLFAGTSDGVIIKTTDGGQTWTNIKKANGPVTGIAIDSSNDWHVYFVVFQSGLLETTNGGKDINDIAQKMDANGHTTSVFSIATDPNSGVIYVGTENGIFRKKGGDQWESLNLIESSKVFPIRAIAVNPRNSRELTYSSSQAIYKSTDGGNQWSTFQLNTSKEISVIKYDPFDPIKVYAGLRKF